MSPSGRAAAVVADAGPSAAGPAARFGSLFDGGRWDPLGAPADDGTAGARGAVDGEPVFAYCSDPAVKGGAMGHGGCATIARTIDAAVDAAAPVVGLWHSGGARLDEGVLALDGVGGVFSAMVRASGRVPQISVVLGPTAGGAAYGAALTDVVVIAPEGRMFVTGPDVIRQVTGERVDMRALGGPEVHDALSGVAHVVADDEQDALARTRSLASLLRPRPGVGGMRTLPVGARPELASVLPARPARAYDVRPLVVALLDTDGQGVELQGDRAPNIVTRLGRLGGRPVGVVANNPIRQGGCLTSAASQKAARFVRTCDAFGVPLVVVVDVPGYLPGVDEEHEGVLRHGAKLLHAFAGARTPRVTLLTRKAYGGAYLAMNPRSMGASAVYAWPSAEVGVMGPQAAVEILHRRALAGATEGPAREALRARLVDGQREIGALDRLVDLGVVDAVIDPADTRTVLHRAIDRATGLRSTQRNIPL